MVDKKFHIHNISFARGADIWPSSDYESFEKGLKPLSRRALLMAGSDDTVVIDKGVGDEYLSLLRESGAGGKDIIIPSCNSESSLCKDILKSNEALEVVKGWDEKFETYMSGSDEEELSEVCGVSASKTPEKIVTLLNDKAFFIRILEDIGAPLIETYIGNSDAVASRILNSGEKKLMARSAVSVGGSCVWPMATDDEKKKAKKEIHALGKNILLLLQPLLSVKESPNIQFYVDDEKVTLLGETKQVLDSKMAHCGNSFDRCGDDVVQLAKKIAMEAVALGYRGVLGVDLIITDGGDIFPVELNARHNTSTHALWFFNKVTTGDPFIQGPDGSGGFYKFCASKNLSGEEWLKALGKYAFDPVSKTGIMPYDDESIDLSAVIIAEGVKERERLCKIANKTALSV